MGFNSKHDFTPSYHLPGASPLPLDVGYLFWVVSNILLLMVVQQQVVILEFSQEKMSTCLLLCHLAKMPLATLSASIEICMQVKKQQLELDMEQQTGSKLEKEYIKAVYCHPVYLTYMQSTS